MPTIATPCVDPLLNNMTSIPSELKALTANLGKCVLICQQIEVMLATIIIIERKQPLSAVNDFINEFAQLRLQMLGALKKELSDLKVTYVDFEHLEQVIKKRNWLVHRLFLDPRFLRIMRGAIDDLSSEVEFLTAAHFKIKFAYAAKIAEVGATNGGIPTDEEAIKQIINFEAVASEISARQAQIKAEKKKK